MEELSEKSFEQILNSTLRMIRGTWNVSACLFLQMDDKGLLRIRASDGLKNGVPSTFGFRPEHGLVSRCFDRNEILDSNQGTWDTGLQDILNPVITTQSSEFILIPVAGQARTLGVLVLGPVTPGMDLKSREAELRGAGNLCAVLSAYWRLYEWMSHFLPQINHELRTPLTAIQGSLGMVLGGVFGNVGTDVKAMLEMAHKGCERTVLAIEEYINKQTPPTNKTPDIK